MALISVIVPQALNALVSDKVFPGPAPQDTEPDWIVYTGLGGPAIGDLDGPDATDYTRVRVDVYSRTLDDAEALRVQVRAAMYQHLKAMPVGGMTTFHEEDTNLTRISQDFAVFH